MNGMLTFKRNSVVGYNSTRCTSTCVSSAQYNTTPHNVVLTSSQMSCLLTPGLRFMIFSSAAFSTPSCVNSTFGLPCSPSTLTFRKYLRSNATYGRYWAASHLLSLLSTAGGMVERGGKDNSKQTHYCAMNKKIKLIYLL